MTNHRIFKRSKSRFEAPQPSAQSVWWAKIAVSLVVIISIIFTVLILNTAINKNVSYLGKAILLIVGASGIMVTLISNKDWNFKDGLLKGVLNTRNIAIFALAIWFGFTAMIQVQGMLAPAQSVESRPQATEKVALRTETKVDALSNQVSALLHNEEATRAELVKAINGVWGEPGCDVTWRITIEGGALSASLNKRDATMAPHNFVGSITSMEPDRIEVRGERPAIANGRAASFILDGSGSIPRLTWHDHSDKVQTVFERCDI
jgi:hypothetical protein